MGVIETPEQQWGKREKPYHLTGEVPEEDYFRRLAPNDYLYLTILLHHFQFVASSNGILLCALAIGSSADLQSMYRDIDLLVCPDDRQVRSEFVHKVYDSLENEKRFYALERYPKGSALSFDPVYAPIKLFALPTSRIDMQGGLMWFDITFLGEGGGTIADVLSFHRQNNLAFSRLEKNFLKNV